MWIGKAMVFPVGMYGCESWTIRKAECQRIDAFELWGWRRLWRVPWTTRRSNQSILKEISPEYSLERLMLKLKPKALATWCEDLTHLKRPWCWGKLKAGGEGETKGEMAGWHHWRMGDGWTLGIGDRQGGLACCSPWGPKESYLTELNWTEARLPFDFNSRRIVLDESGKKLLNWPESMWNSKGIKNSGLGQSDQISLASLKIQLEDERNKETASSPR